ncbi:MAG TPA: leucine-rich repeat domain-containing protein [Oligoflexus sp.]|uniref:leucine-rich repeat domain-containing protein n=1 Tax=Oligoflexus sp. TaxID=1971216 RepID=UPI002D2F0881|nr:leucine-rich repeat domain-containing protein [Oligoflexus sp.]HYX35619.1 leucine-rich repeat domain-containing protein [Oligoflexus sp.]
MKHGSRVHQYLLILVVALTSCSIRKKSRNHGADQVDDTNTTVVANDPDKQSTDMVVTREIEGEVVVIDKLLSGDPKILDGIQKISREPGDGSDFLKSCRNPTDSNGPLVEALKAITGETDCVRAHDKLIYMREFWVTESLSIGDISLLSKLTNITLLHFAANDLQDISPLATLVNLETLHLDDNKINDLRPLAALPKLRSLNLSNNKISDLGPLSMIKTLAILDLDFNQIVDISPLQGLTALQQLLLSGNLVQDVGSISSLNKLRELHLSSNAISDLSPLAGLNDLVVLHIVSVPVVSLAPIATLSLLTALDARDTPVERGRTPENCPTNAASPAVQAFCAAP